MLTIAPNAAQAIEGLVEATSDEAADAGLRISHERAADDGAQPAFRVEVVPSPAPEDVVVEEAGARVYLAEDTATQLDHAILDAQVEGANVQFVLAQDPG